MASGKVQGHGRAREIPAPPRPLPNALGSPSRRQPGCTAVAEGASAPIGYLAPVPV